MSAKQRISALHQAYKQRRRREAKEEYRERVEDYVEVMKINPEFIKGALREDPKALNNMDNALFEAALGKSRSQFKKVFPNVAQRHLHYKILRECNLATGKAIFVHDRRDLRGNKTRRKNWTAPGPSPLGKVWIPDEIQIPDAKSDPFSRADWIRKHLGIGHHQ